MPANVHTKEAWSSFPPFKAPYDIIAVFKKLVDIGRALPTTLLHLSYYVLRQQ